MKHRLRPAKGTQKRRRDEFLDALVEFFPFGLWDIAFQFPIAAVDRNGVALDLDRIGLEIDEKLHVGAVKVDICAEATPDAPAHLTVEFGAQFLARLGIEPCVDAE